MTVARIKITNELAIKILKMVGNRSNLMQSNEWLQLRWQTLNELEKIRMINKYLVHTKEG